MMNRSISLQTELKDTVNTSLDSMAWEDSIGSLNESTTRLYWDMERVVQLMGCSLQESDAIAKAITKNTLNQHHEQLPK